MIAYHISTGVSFRIDCLEQALSTHGVPDVFNGDQGPQFISETFTDVLKRESVTISMIRRGHALTV